MDIEVYRKVVANLAVMRFSSYKSFEDYLHRMLLKEALVKAGGNKTKAAKILNMRRTTFIERVKRYKEK